VYRRLEKENAVRPGVAVRAEDQLGQTALYNGKVYDTIKAMVHLREYLDCNGRSPFAEWRSELDPEARRKVTTALYRVGLGNFSTVQGVGAGVFECRINFGPGYRVYFGKDGEQIVVLLGGGTKHRQQNDIGLAHGRWEDYKKRKNPQKREE
jgi:putative addiction module killer protein